MVAAAVEAEDAVLPHPATTRLAALLAELAEATADALTGVEDVGGEASEADLVDQIGLLERLRSAVAATQAAAMVQLARARVARETSEGRRPDTVGRGLAEEIGLACRIAPTLAARRLSAARSWWFDLPRTFAALATGPLHERVANAVVSETRHLDPVRRREVDARLHSDPGHGADPHDVASMGVRKPLAATAEAAYQADPRAYVGRGRTERDDRHVTLRPAPDTMSWLSGYLPVEQGVACLAALKRHTDTAVAAGDDRTRGQIMADTLVERLTGQTHASEVAVEIQLLVPAGSSRTRPGRVPGGDTARQDTDARETCGQVEHAGDHDPDGRCVGAGGGSGGYEPDGEESETAVLTGNRVVADGVRAAAGRHER